MAMTPEQSPEQSSSNSSGLKPVFGASLQLSHDAAHDEGVFTSLIHGIRDVIFPQKLPPLQLESKPIPVKEPLRFKRDPRGLVSAIVIEGLLILIIGYVVTRKIIKIMAPQHQVVDLTVPPPTPPKPNLMGGGGGQKGPTPVTKGNVPKIAPPVIPRIETPKIPAPPTIDLDKDIKMPTVPLPNFGDPHSPLVGSSLGNGTGGGIGSGNGGGLGAGSGGNTGGGVRRIGGGVSAPVVIYQVEPEFSEEARKAKFAGNVLVALQVDAQGRPQNVHVISGVGMGLDDKAVEAVKQYKFKPAMEAGKPVTVALNIEVNFQIF